MAEEILTSEARDNTLLERMDDLIGALDETSDELKKINAAISRLSGLGNLASIFKGVFNSQPAPRVRRR